jgi:hypothetical protein
MAKEDRDKGTPINGNGKAGVTDAICDSRQSHYEHRTLGAD